MAKSLRAGYRTVLDDHFPDQVKITYGKVGSVTSTPFELFVEGINNDVMAKDAYGVRGTDVMITCIIVKKSTASVDWLESTTLTNWDCSVIYRFKAPLYSSS